jgi:HEAT repeat protein
MDVQHPIDETVAWLASDEALANARLAELASLNRDDLARLKVAWTRIAADRRLQTVQRLVELAEDNFELNFDDVFRFCLKDTDATVRALAVEGLWENEAPSLIDPLIALLETDESPDVQAAAATALGKFTLLAENGKLRPQYGPRLKESLLKVTNEKRRPEEVRRRALEAVAPISAPEVKLAIGDAFRNGTPRFRVSAVFAMGRSCDPDWLPILLHELESKDAEVRYEATSALGELGEQEAVASLIRLTADADTEVRLASFQALGKIGGPKSKEFLRYSLGSKDPAVRDAAQQALDELRATEDPLSLQL